MRFFSAGDWARRVTGKKFDSGELVKLELKHRLPSGFQSYVLNTRRERLKDVRVRQALGLAMDYEWMNRQMFYNAYQRVNGLFGNTDCQATGQPSADELALLNRWRGQVPDTVFGPMATPPRTDGDSSLRGNLLKAKQLLADAAGFTKTGLCEMPRPCAGAGVPGQQRKRRPRGLALDSQPGKAGHHPQVPPGGLCAVPAAAAKV